MKISTRQICFIMLMYTAASKLLMYPTELSIACERDLLVPAAVDFLLCGAAVWGVAYLCSKTDKTFFELLSSTFGRVAARIVMGLFAIFFAMAALMPTLVQEHYVKATFYDMSVNLTAFLPFFVFAWYAAGKKLINAGRCADFCLPIFIVVMVLILIMGMTEADFSNLLPILKTPPEKLVAGSTGTLFNFVEPCWLLMFMGRFKYKKGDAAKITLSYAGGAATVLLFLAMFCGVYGAIAPSRTFAVARTSLFFPAIEVIGRVDLLLLFALEVVQLFALALNLQLSVYSFSECTGYDNLPVISLGVTSLLLAATVLLANSYKVTYELYFKWLWIVFAVFVLLVPALCWFLKRGKRNEKQAE